MTIFPRPSFLHRSRRFAPLGTLVLRGSLALTCLFAASGMHAAALPNRLQAGASLQERAALPQGVSRRVTQATALGHLNGDTLLQTMSLELAPSAAQTAALDKLLVEQQDPASPNYHKWLTPTEFGNRFGASDSDLQVLESWLTSQGMQVVSVAPSRNRIQFSGTASTVESAFRTTLGRFQRNGQNFFENSTAPQVPAAFRDIVLGVRGLSSYRMRSHSAKRLDPQTAAASPNNTVNRKDGTVVHYLTPYDVRQIYGASTLTSSGFDGTGVRIGVIGQSAVDTSQLALFQSLTGQTVKQPQLLLVSGSGISTVYSGDEGESESDLEYAGGIAPGASLVFIYTGNNANTDVITALEYAITFNSAPILNLSYGGCELAYSSDALTIEQSLKQANAQGQTVLVSSGDDGAASCEDAGTTTAYNGLQVSYPASSPYVTAVGGTTFNEGTGNYWASSNNSQAGSALSYIPEIAWNDTTAGSTFSSSGGGASRLFSKPNWQTGPGVPADGARDVPDVAFAASPDHDPYLLCTSDTSFSAVSSTTGANLTGACTSTLFGNFVIGGTSLSSPSFAGMLALAVQANKGAALGNINPRLYSLAAGSSASTVFQDIASGNNIVPCASGTLNCNNLQFGFPAGTGYDEVTGLGSVNMGGFSAALSASTAATAHVATITILTASSTATGTVYQITVAGADSSTVPTGTVNVSIDGGTATPVALTSGVGSFTLTNSSIAAGVHTLTAAYTGDTNYAAASTSISVTTGTASGTLGLSLSSPGLTVAAAAKATETVQLTSTAYSGLVVYSLAAATGSALPTTGCFLGRSNIGINAGGTVSTSITYSRVTSDCTSATVLLKLGSQTAGNHLSSPIITSSRNMPAPLLVISVAGGLLGGFFLRRRRTWAGSLLAVAFTAALLGISGCGNGSAPISTTTPTPTPTPSPTTTGTYTLTLTATSYPAGSISASSNFTVTLQ